MARDKDPFATFIEWGEENDKVFDDLNTSSERKIIQEGEDTLKASPLSQKNLIDRIDRDNLPESFDDLPVGKEKL